MDSQLVVEKLKTPATKNHAYFCILNECQNLVQNGDWNVQVNHCFREANKAADLLTLVYQATSLVLYDSPPPGLYQILFEDLAGVAWTRTVRS